MKKKKTFLLSGALLLMFAVAPIANAGSSLPVPLPTDGGGGSKPPACTPQGYCPIPT
ncbi:MAG TPA: hypothetical protein K8V56_17885 [Sporosarcina psychrophila]|uniref:Uncharacterized protein n=1 Tax=Sporosarcina psychrophila TaxID=1476 RepID=A0A921G259_SPOPS|nr:hypothetical protein [Sporosarcina psychrophila]